LLTIEKNSDALTVTAPMGAIAQEHRGSGLATLGPVILEAVGRLSGAELAYYFATLKTIHQQVLAERHGYALVGIVPAYDRDMVESGNILRVYEAIYAKILASRERVLIPRQESLTPKTKKLFDFLFSNL
jgi:hypothetical protein